ncbi:MAG: carbohydrate kinase family protein [Oscillospiraceae bacterium]|nr:carbohydrate kinase family protein [Oscillospiraceae bacterium]
MSEKDIDIIGIGVPCVDILTVVEKLPRPDSGSGILDFSRQGGGNVATAVVASSRLGVKSGFIGLSGICLNGKFIREDFKYNGVDISRSTTIEGKPSDFAIILSDLETRGRSILYRGGNLRKIELGDLDKDYITGAKILHLEGCGEVEKTAALWMKDSGRKVAYDVARYSKQIEAFTPYIDYFIASEFYYKGKFGDSDSVTMADYEKNCRLIAEQGPEIVVFTLGGRGCVGYTKSEGFFFEESFKVNVFDTLGAGDVYHGAFLAGLIKGFGVRETARFANAVSGIKIGYIGGRAGIPTFGVADKFIKTGEIDDGEILRRVEAYRNKWIYGEA